MLWGKRFARDIFFRYLPRRETTEACGPLAKRVVLKGVQVWSKRRHAHLDFPKRKVSMCTPPLLGFKLDKQPDSAVNRGEGFMVPPPANSKFPTTQWTGVLEVLGTSDEAARGEVIADLCREYWYPLYAFARRTGHTPEDAEDLTQGFFGYAMENDLFSLADRKLGKLRTFLIRVFQRYIGDVRDREMAQKRGGGMQMCSLNLENGEELYSRELVSTDTPELVFDRTWAHSLLRSTLSALRHEEGNAGRERQYEILHPFLSPDTVTDNCYEHSGLALGLPPEGVRQAVCRLRRKFKVHLRAQVAATLKKANDLQIDEEIRSLKVALRG
jgi:RNA polymerase sigma-70 factor (ECF subfamily)